MVYCYRGQLSCSNLYAQTHIEPRSYLYGAFERHHLQQTPYSKHHESSCFRRKYFQSKQLKNLFILFTSSAVFIEESFCVLPFTYLFLNFTPLHTHYNMCNNSTFLKLCFIYISIPNFLLFSHFLFFSSFCYLTLTSKEGKLLTQPHFISWSHSRNSNDTTVTSLQLSVDLKLASPKMLQVTRLCLFCKNTQMSNS